MENTRNLQDIVLKRAWGDDIPPLIPILDTSLVEEQEYFQAYV